MTEDGGEAAAFDLQRLLRDAHGAVAPAAEYAGIGLAWYMPPHLGQLYRGDARTLGETLGLLLESAVRATRQGAVHLSARRVPESSDAGNILFTVTDTGTGAPPRERSSLALARAGELAARHGGYVGMEYGPNGTTIAFSLHLEPLEDSAEDLPGEGLPHIIVVAEDPAQRRELARMAADLPCRCSEAGSEHEALRRHEADPAVLLVAQGRYALPAAADMVAKFMEIAAEAGLSGCKVLAITADDSQWNLLADSGFTHALLEPVDAEALRQTVRDVIRNARRTRPAAPKAPEKGEDAPQAEAAENAETAAEAPATDAAASAPEGTGEAADAAPAPAEETPAAKEKTPAEAPEVPEAEAPAAAGETEQVPVPDQPETAEESPAVDEIKDEAAEVVAAAPAAEAAESAPALEEKQEDAGAEPAEAAVAEAPPAAEEGPQAVADVPTPPEDSGSSAAELSDTAVSAPETGAEAETGDFLASVVEARPAAPEAESPAPAPAQDAPQAQEEKPAPEAAPTAAPESPGPAHAAAPRHTAAQTARASVYVSPALASPGEWVGEPMPIGTPVPRRETREPAAEGRPEARSEASSASWPRPEAQSDAAPREEAPAWRRGPAQSTPGGYTSPSVPVPGEWVGEPMPIPRKPAAAAVEEGVDATAPQPEEVRAAAPETEPASTAPLAGEGGSLMDFIVGATRVEAAPPAAPVRPAAGDPPSGGMTDFVERSVTLVTSAVSSALAPAAEADAASAPQAATGGASHEAHDAGPNSGAGAASEDAAILALVARLDAAMAEANSAHAAGRGHMVAQAAAKIAEESESFGFRVLARMARCVERAGRAGDMNALRDLLPELAVSVERNRIALTQHK